ncbi:MAG: DUF5677 domain-containing protein [Pseudomonadota bacterium]
MQFLTEAMGRALYLLRTGVALVPNDEISTNGYIKRRAVVVGHMVRLTKLFDGLYLHIANRQLELAGVMLRLIFETEIRLNYLMTKASSKSYRSYILASYRAERENLMDLDAKAKTRRLVPIEIRMRTSILKHLRRDGISRKQLLRNRVWDIDGKNVRELMRDLGRQEFYSYSFGSSSRWIHGSWQELYHYHLQKVGSRFVPRLEFGDPDTRSAAPPTIICLDTLLAYLNWSRGDPGGSVRRLLAEFRDMLIRLDQEHEYRMSTNTS